MSSGSGQSRLSRNPMKPTCRIAEIATVIPRMAEAITPLITPPRMLAGNTGLGRGGGGLTNWKRRATSSSPEPKATRP